MESRRLCVAVTGLHCGENPAPGTSVIRCIRAEPAFQGSVVGLAYDPLDAGIYADGLIDAVYLLPYPLTGLQAIKDRLAFADEAYKIDFLIPTLDTELSSFIRLKSFLSDRGIHTLLPSEDAWSATLKARLPALAEKCSFATPLIRPVFSQFAASLGIPGIHYPTWWPPVMVKGVFNEAYLAFSSAQAYVYCGALASRWGYPVILQEHIVGTEYDIAALGDGTKEMIGCVAMRKESISSSGKSTSGVIVYEEELFDLAKRIIECLSWNGPLEIEVIKAARDGLWYILEINPRFPTWVFAAAAAGQNLPFAALQLAFNEDVKPMREYTTGMRFSRYTSDLIVRQPDFETLSSSGELMREDVNEGTI